MYLGVVGVGPMLLECVPIGLNIGNVVTKRRHERLVALGLFVILRMLDRFRELYITCPAQNDGKNFGTNRGPSSVSKEEGSP